jgi:hypothetical protein
VVDLLPAFRGRSAADLWVSEQDYHPNAVAHAIAARPLIEGLRAGSLAAVPPRRFPHPQVGWLNDARTLLATQGTTLEGARVATTLATSAALLAEVEAGDTNGSFYREALAFALECQQAISNFGRR